MKLVASLAACALVAAAAPAAVQAASADDTPSITVGYADLDLSRASDARTLLHRIRKAAAAACAQNGNSFEEARRFDACHREAVRQAVDGLHAPAVFAAYAEQWRARAVAAR